ncbi:MAG: hypothetical protein ACR2HR_04710 [Euzebya sp.]
MASRAQATTVGFGGEELRRLVDKGVLVRPSIRVVASVSPETLSYRGRIWEVQLSILRDSVASHWTALWLYGLMRRVPDQVWVTVRGKWAPSRPGVRTIATRCLPEDAVVNMSGVAVTSIERTLVDVARFTPPPRLRGMLLDARQRGLTDEERVAAMAEARRGAKGSVGVLRLCHQIAPQRADSELEQIFRDAIRVSGLPDPHPEPLVIQTPDGARQLDVAWPQFRVGADCDGLAYHGSRVAHDEDAERRTAINLTAWRIVFVTWSRVELRWQRLEADMQRALLLGGRSHAA